MAPGEPLLLRWPKEFTRISLNGKSLSRYHESYGFGAVGAGGQQVVYLVGHESVQVGHAFRSPGQRMFIQPVYVNYPKDEQVAIRLPSSVIQKLSAQDDEVKEQQKLYMREILTQEAGQLQFECWQRPLRSKVVSQFASARTLPDGHQYYHTGLDLRAWTGTPIHAAAEGRVVFADEMIVPGRMVVLDHGGGLFSRYMHLNEIRAKVGNVFKKNEILGLSGATGRVEAPHLHWEVVWKGQHVDPLKFVALAKQECQN